MKRVQAMIFLIDAYDIVGTGNMNEDYIAQVSSKHVWCRKMKFDAVDIILFF